MNTIAVPDSISDDSSDRVVVAFGDSTTAPRPNVVTYSELLQSHFADHPVGIRIVNAGVPGDTTAHAANRFDKDVLANNPHLVIMQFGVNDAAVDVWRMPPAKRTRISLLIYKKNLRLLVRSLRSISAEVILMTPNPLTWTDFMKKRYGRFPYDPTHEDGCNLVLRDYAEAVRELAAEEEVGLVDVYSAFKDRSKSFGLATDDLLLDGMHPNSTGHAVIARLLINHLSEPPGFSSLRWTSNSGFLSTTRPRVTTNSSQGAEAE